MRLALKVDMDFVDVTLIYGPGINIFQFERP